MKLVSFTLCVSSFWEVYTCFHLSAILNPRNPRFSGGYYSRVDQSVCACVLGQLLLFGLLLVLLVLTAQKRSLLCKIKMIAGRDIVKLYRYNTYLLVLCNVSSVIKF